MKKMYLSLIALFVVNTLFAQIWDKEGIVKGKNVTYEVFRGKKNLRVFTFIRNVNNPDTTFREIPNRDITPPQMVDVEMQVAEILHNELSSEELAKWKSAFFGVTFRVDPQKRKLLQVTNFFYINGLTFLESVSPDRLYELEQVILKKLKLPSKLQETYIENDFFVVPMGREIQHIESVREMRKKAIKAWKEKDYEVKVRPWPKFVLKDSSCKEQAK